MAGSRTYLTGHHSLVTALLVTLISTVEVSIADVLSRDPEAARGVLLRARGPALVVCFVLLSVIWREICVRRVVPVVSQDRQGMGVYSTKKSLYFLGPN